MKNIHILILVFSVLLLAAPSVLSATDISNSFYNCGIPVSVSKPRGIVATIDGNGKNVVLVWLLDYRGGYELLKIDAVTGESEEFPTPFLPESDCPFASIMSSRNKYYTHFNSHFIEFDIGKRAFTFVQTTSPKTSMSMTEDDNGIIWSATYPTCAIVSYNPQTREFKDYGQIYTQSWSQYPRYIAADDKGWIYVAIGETSSQIIAFNPLTAKTMPMIPESERKNGLAYLYRDLNGKVYGKSLEGSYGEWYEFYDGKGEKIGSHTTVNKKQYISGMQGLFYKLFPNGERIKILDFETRQLIIEKNSQVIRSLHFDYISEGSLIVSVGVAPDGTICGGSFKPKEFYSYNPQTGQMLHRPGYGQWNTVVSQNGKFFIGGYTNCFLLEWDPLKNWVPTEKNKTQCNPLLRCEGAADIYRPHKILALTNGKIIILAGTPGYGLTGGGLLFWNRESQTMKVLKHTEIIPEQSTMSLVSFSTEQILGGTTTSPGTGGVKKANEAELYLMDINSKHLLWHKAILPGVQEYSDLCLAKNGMVYGVADRKTFFVFDVNKRKIIYQNDILGRIPHQQGPRILIASPQNIYILYFDGIAKINSETYEITRLVTSSVPVTAGGDFHDGRIYFGSGSRLYSYVVEPQVQKKMDGPTSLKLH